MNIAVAIRLMPKVGDELEVDESGTDIDRELVEMAINEFDDQALEEAVLIKEATGATVTAVGLRAEGIEQALHVAYARGPTGWSSSTRARSTRTTRARRRSPSRRRSASWLPTSCSTGVQTPYDVFGQTAPYLAATLGWPQASVVVGVTAGRRDRARRAGVRGRAAGRARPPTAGRRRRAVRKLAAPLRRDGAPTPGDDRGDHRDARRQRRGARRGADAHRSAGLRRRATRRCSRAMPERRRRRSLEVLRERGALVS